MIKILRAAHDLRAARVAELALQREQLVGNDVGDPRRRGQHVQQIGDLLHHFAIFVDDLVLLEPGQALQAHLQDLLGLFVRQPIQPIVHQPEARVHRLRAIGVHIAARARQHLAHDRRIPRAAHQSGLCHRRRRRRLDQRDELVDVGQRHREPFQHVAASARLAQLEHRAPRDHFAPMRQERVEHLLQVQHARLAVDQRHHVDAERVLQLRLLVQVVQHDIRLLVALQLEDDAHAGLVRFIADVGDAFDPLFVDHFGDALEQHALVHLIRQLIDDDRRARALVDFLEVRLRAHHHAAAAGAIALAHAFDAVDDSRGRKIRRRNQLDQFIDASPADCATASCSRRSLRRGYAAECWSPSRPRCRQSR